MADKQYDLSSRELELIQKRAKLRAELQAHYVKQVTNPYRHMSGEGGFVFDPALQRYLSMKATMYDHFKPNVKTGLLYFGLVIAPIVGLTWYFHVEKTEFERKCRSGEIPYKDRRFKFQ